MALHGADAPTPVRGGSGAYRAGRLACAGAGHLISTERHQYGRLRYGALELGVAFLLALGDGLLCIRSASWADRRVQ